MRLYLVKYEDSWADELDISGLSLMDNIQLDRYKEHMLEYFEETKKDFVQFYFGSNQFVEYDNFDEFWERIEVHLIDGATWDRLYVIFNGVDFGWIPDY